MRSFAIEEASSPLPALCANANDVLKDEIEIQIERGLRGFFKKMNHIDIGMIVILMSRNDLAGLF